MLGLTLTSADNDENLPRWSQLVKIYEKFQTQHYPSSEARRDDVEDRRRDPRAPGRHVRHILWCFGRASSWLSRRSLHEHRARFAKSFEFRDDLLIELNRKEAGERARRDHLARFEAGILA